jgi:hypothetical protein
MGNEGRKGCRLPVESCSLWRRIPWQNLARSARLSDRALQKGRDPNCPQITQTTQKAVEGRGAANAGVVKHCSAVRVSGGAMLPRSGPVLRARRDLRANFIKPNQRLQRARALLGVAGPVIPDSAAEPRTKNASSLESSGRACCPFCRQPTRVLLREGPPSRYTRGVPALDSS